MAKIIAPNERFKGASRGVHFDKGVGYTDDEKVIARFKAAGFTVEGSDHDPTPALESAFDASQLIALVADVDDGPLMDWVGDDPHRATVALSIENSYPEARADLVQRLQEIGDSAIEGIQATEYAGIRLGGPEEIDGDESPDETAGAESDYPTHKGGGYYELSDGSKVKGKKAAEEAEAKL